MKDLRLKLSAMLGNDDMFFSADFFIVTNISLIYESLNKNFIAIGNEAVGFWKSLCIDIGGRTCVVSKIPPGNNIRDYLRLVKGFGKPIFLCGFCGGLSEKVDVGFFVDNASLNASREGYVLSEVDGMIQDEDFYISLRESGVDIIDMESKTLYEFGRDNDIMTKSLLIVSDHVFVDPFYGGKEKKGRIVEGIEKLVGYFLKMTF